jgi:glycosyltransferase 2 family protein
VTADQRSRAGSSAAQPTQSTLLERAGAAAADMGSIGRDRPRLRMAIQAGLAALIFAALVGFLLSQWSKLPDYDWRFSPGWLAVSAAAIAAFYLVQAEIWRFILRSLGEEFAARPARGAWAKSLVARYVPTNVLMPVVRVLAAERYGVKKRVTLASIAYELLLALCAAVIGGAYFVITLPSLEDQPARFAILAVIPLVLVVLHPRIFHRLADFGLRKLGREPLPLSLPFDRVLLIVCLYLVSWTLIGIGTFAFASSLHDIEAGDLAYIAASYPVAFCVSVLTFIVPSGLGTRDATLATALDAVLPAAVATAIAVALRLFQTAIELAVVGTFTLLARRR